MNAKKKMLLMILDGWGIGRKDKSDVIFTANTPNMDRLAKEFPSSQLLTSGRNVGLPDGVMGNSEVGHLNIGAGRVLYQDLVKINLACEDGSIAQNPALVEAFTYAKKQQQSGAFYRTCVRWRRTLNGYPPLQTLRCNKKFWT
jgi:2,3-bisphosphoglycerate-independent phosphoglycerate mutase